MQRASTLLLRAALRRWRGDERGNVALTFALAMLPIIAMLGAAIDYGRLSFARVQVQDAMDGAVILAVTKSTAAAGTFFTGAAAQSNATIVGAPSFVTNSDGSVSGSANAVLPTSMMGIVGLTQMQFSVQAKAGVATSTTSTPAAVCLSVLDPNASQALLVNSSVTINAPNCEIDVASNGSPAAIFNSGDNFNVAKICVHGTNVIENGGAVAGLSTGCTTAANPFKGNMPTVSNTTCTVSGQNYSGSNTLSPGVYCGGFNFNGSGTLTLQPGLYVFESTNWNLNSGWTVSGSGVTFYFADQNSYIQVNSGVTMNISAPTSGTYANILMFEPSGLAQSSFTINGSAGHKFSGLVYLPSRNVTFNSMSTVNSESLTMVFNQLILDTDNWSIAPGAKSIASASTTTTTTTAGAPRLVK